MAANITKTMTIPIRLNDIIVTRRLIGRAEINYTATGDVVRLTYKAMGEELRVLYKATTADGQTVHIRESKVLRVERSGKVVWTKEEGLRGPGESVPVNAAEASDPEPR